MICMKLPESIQSIVANLKDLDFSGSGKKKFGTFGGVFTPDVLTILGVIMYLRLGWVVGNAGFLGALAIILLAKTITICTTALLIFILTTAFISFAEERISLTTYYPAPYGVYRDMRANMLAVGSGVRSTGINDGDLLVGGQICLNNTGLSPITFEIYLTVISARLSQGNTTPMRPSLVKG